MKLATNTTQVCYHDVINNFINRNTKTHTETCNDVALCETSNKHNSSLLLLSLLQIIWTHNSVHVPPSRRETDVLRKHFNIQLIHNIQYVDTIKIITYLKVLQHVSDHRGSFIRERLQCLAKITKMVLSCPLTWTRSVLWQHIVICTCAGHNMLP